MIKPEVISTYGQKCDFELDSPTEIYIDMVPCDPDKQCIMPKPEGTKRVLVVVEPDIVTGFSMSVIKFSRHWQLDHILTFDENILNLCDQASLFEFGTSWIDPDESNNKNFSVSTVCGKKGVTPNRIKREELFRRQAEIKIETDFYVSGRENMEGEKVLGDSKAPLFESMFHVCIENVSQKYYFSEKLLDPLLRKSIPIYVGCTNIGEYFNLDGMICVDTVDEIVSACNQLTPEYYTSRSSAIQENFEKAKYWKDWNARLESKLKELI